MSGGRQSWLAVDSYADSGCPDLGIPSCLSCPLPACRLDLAPKQAAALVRQMRLVALLDQGLTGDELAAQMGVSRRTIFRLKQGLTTAAVMRGAFVSSGSQREQQDRDVAS